jgi:plastocyanin
LTRSFPPVKSITIPLTIHVATIESSLPYTNIKLLMKNKILCLNILILLIVGLGIVSCGKSSSYNTNMPPSANSVSIINMSFSPATITVAPGTTVTWTNNDGMTHTVTADDISFDSGNITTGSKFSRVFSTVGSYSYHCTIHPNMKGTIIVK